MKAHIEWLDPVIGVLRVGPDFKEFGDPFVASCTVVLKANNGLKIHGFTAKSDAFNSEMFRAISDLFKSIGIRRVSYERMKPKGALSKEKIPR